MPQFLDFNQKNTFRFPRITDKRKTLFLSSPGIRLFRLRAAYLSLTNLKKSNIIKAK